jgi:hypothetical protein
MKILPIEVKAGVRGGMKSLFNFMTDKQLEIGVRTSLENFGTFMHKDKQIDIYPLYALSGIA